MGPFVQVVLGQIISLFGNAALRFVLPLILLRQTGFGGGVRCGDCAGTASSAGRDTGRRRSG